MTTIVLQESDGKVHTNVFAQIDEIDEDTCSLSPETKSRRLSSLKSVEDEGETKPLLTCSQTSPCNLRKADDIKNGSRLDPNEVLGIEKVSKICMKWVATIKSVYMGPSSSVLL